MDSLLILLLMLPMLCLASFQQISETNSRISTVINGKISKSPQGKELLEKYVQQKVDEQDFKSIMSMLYWVRDERQKYFVQTCMERFKSRSLCVHKNVSFFIWQQIEARRLWNNIMKHGTNGIKSN